MMPLVAGAQSALNSRYQKKIFLPYSQASSVTSLVDHTRLNNQAVLWSGSGHPLPFIQQIIYSGELLEWVQSMPLNLLVDAIDSQSNANH